MNTELSIQILQAYATGLSAQSMQHKVQSKVFASMGLSKLASKYADHATEEMAWVDKFIDRIIDLGGCPKVEKHDARELICDPLEYLKADLAIQVQGVDILRKCMATVADDPTTYDMLKAYLLDEEEDQYWSEEQLELIEKIGYQNWLIKQM